MPPHEEFSCPNCHAHYKVVRVRTEPGKRYQAVHRRVCHADLAPIDGDDILKYFLFHRPQKTGPESAPNGANR